MIDFLVVGQGLAGSILALELIANGHSVCVVDDGFKTSSSWPAAGIVDPITGKRVVRSWRLDDFLPLVQRYYPALEVKLGQSFWFDRPIRRYFTSDEERSFFDKKQFAPKYAALLSRPFLAEQTPGLGYDRDGVVNDRGGFELDGHYLDTKVFLSAVRQYFIRKNVLKEDLFSTDNLIIQDRGVNWQGLRAKALVFCDGFRFSKNGFFDFVPVRHAKGEILTLRAPDLDTPKIWSKGQWCLSTQNGEFRYGATYTWSWPTLAPDGGRIASLVEGAQTFLNRPVALVRAEAGVRPVVRDFRPVIGQHPQHRSVMVFNGFGSKGVAMIPYFAQHFSRVVAQQETWEPEVAVDRFF